MEWPTLKITWEPDLPILFYHWGNQLKSFSSYGCCALTDNVSLLVITNMFIFFFCLNNVQYVIYGNSENKHWIELRCCCYCFFSLVQKKWGSCIKNNVLIPAKLKLSVKHWTHKLWKRDVKVTQQSWLINLNPKHHNANFTQNPALADFFGKI